MEMLLTGDMIEAAEALRLGLVNRAVPGEALEAETLDLARKVMSKSPLILKIGKEAFYRQIEHGLVEAYAYASQVMPTNMLAPDPAEGIDAFIAKPSPAGEGRYPPLAAPPTSSNAELLAHRPTTRIPASSRVDTPWKRPSTFPHK